MLRYDVLTTFMMIVSERVEITFGRHRGQIGEVVECGEAYAYGAILDGDQFYIHRFFYDELEYTGSALLSTLIFSSDGEEMKE